MIDSTKRKFQKETQTGNPWSTVGCNTDLSLCHKKYDDVFDSQKAVDSILEERLFKKSLCINTQAISELFGEGGKQANPGRDYNRQLAEVLEQTIKPTFAQMIDKNAVAADVQPLLVARRETNVFEEQSVGQSDTSGSPVKFGKQSSPAKPPGKLGERSSLLSVVKVEEEDHSSDGSSHAENLEIPADIFGEKPAPDNSKKDQSSVSAF